MTLDLDTILLKAGAHRSREEGTCLLEAVAWFAGEEHTDHPKCVSPVLAAFGRSWNDGLWSDEERKQLKPYIPLLVGTVASPEVEEQRAWMATDWLVRVCTPTWLRLAGLDDHAEALERLEPLVSAELAERATPAVAAAVTAGVTAAVAAAVRAAAEDAGGVAVVDAARLAAMDAARHAARHVAGDSAVAAVHGATWAAAVNALEPTVRELQTSAHDLYRRMIAAT